MDNNVPTVNSVQHFSDEDLWSDSAVLESVPAQQNRGLPTTAGYNPLFTGYVPTSATGSAANSSSLIRRFVASLLDGLILFVALGLVSTPIVLMLLTANAGTSVTQFVILLVLACVIPTVISLVYNIALVKIYGATPGKKLLGLEIVRYGSLESLSWGASIIRTIVMVALGIFVVVTIFGKEHRSVSDYAASSQVIKL